MKTNLLLPLAALLVGGCANGHWFSERDVRASNVIEYDSYVARRVEELAAGGKYTRAEAGQIAENEATRRYGARSDGAGSSHTTGYRWGGRQSRELSLAELDEALAGMKKSR